MSADMLERLSAVAEADRCTALARLATREALILMGQEATR